MGCRLKHVTVKHSISGVRERHGTYERHRELLEYVQARLPRNLSPHEREGTWGRYVTEFSGRHNDRTSDTVDQMAKIVQGMGGKRLRYRDLIA